MADVMTQTPKTEPSRGVLFYVGSAGLLFAMLVEALAVLGRHAGLPFLGALEMIQAAILLTACAAMVSATLHRAHASVTLLIDRLPSDAQHVLRCFAALLSIAFFTGLAAGALWLTIDTWNEFEQSELLHVPFRPLRVISFVAAAAIAVLFVRAIIRGKVERA